MVTPFPGFAHVVVVVKAFYEKSHCHQLSCYTQTINNQQIEYHTGPTLVVNNTFRSPTIGVGNTYYVSLRDARLGSDKNTVPGKEVGVARIYDMRLESGSYSLTNDQESHCFKIWTLSKYKDWFTNSLLKVGSLYILA